MCVYLYIHIINKQYTYIYKQNFYVWLWLIAINRLTALLMINLMCPYLMSHLMSCSGLYWNWNKKMIIMIIILPKRKSSSFFKYADSWSNNNALCLGPLTAADTGSEHNHSPTSAPLHTYRLHQICWSFSVYYIQPICFVLQHLHTQINVIISWPTFKHGQ